MANKTWVLEATLTWLAGLAGWTGRHHESRQGTASLLGSNIVIGDENVRRLDAARFGPMPLCARKPTTIGRSRPPFKSAAVVVLCLVSEAPGHSICREMLLKSALEGRIDLGLSMRIQ